jgi:Na+/H+ antiporter NhaA
MVAPSGGCRRRPGLAAVAGIGFTVSLFIADLSFDAGSTLQSWPRWAFSWDLWRPP